MNNKLAKKIRKHAEALVASGLTIPVYDEDEGLLEEIVPDVDDVISEIRRRVSTGMVKPEDIPDYGEEDD